MQCPLGVEGDISAGGDLRAIRIGRAAAIRRRVPNGEVIVRAGEGVGSQGGRLVGLHGLGGHGAVAFIGVEGNDRVLRPLGIQSGVFRKGHIRLVRIGLAGAVRRSVPAGEGVILAGKGVGGQHVSNTGVDAHGLHAARAAVGVKGDGDLIRLDRPFAVGVHIGIARLGTGRLSKAAIRVVQLRSGDRDGNGRHFRTKTRTALCTLVGVRCRAGDCGLDKFAGTPAGINVRAASSRIDAARSVQYTVHVDGGIRNGTASRSGGRVRHRANTIFGIPDIVFAPLVCIVNIQVRAGLNVQLRALVNRHPCTRKQRRVL